jgi:signal transduction histidine kinase
MRTGGLPIVPSAARAAQAARARLRSARAISLRPASWPNSALAAVLIAILLSSWFLSDASRITPRTIVGGGIALFPFLLIPWRPRIGEALLAVSAACGVGSALFGVVGGPDIVACVAVYTIGTRRRWPATLAAIGIATAASAAVSLVAVPNGSDSTILRDGGAEFVIAAATGILGRTMAGRRAYVRGLVDRTEDLERERDKLEREREVLARQAVAVERARIARELHDVVAHHVSVMVIQAGAAQATLPPGADAAEQSLEAIRQTGREALAEMRRLLGLLRSEASLDELGRDGAARLDSSGSGRAGEAATPRAPQPGLSDLEALAQRTREAGLIVDLEAGTGPRLSAGVDLSAYRVVQEALTNTLRHAGMGARVHVCLDYGPQELSVEVADDGHGRPAHQVQRGANEVGHGLVGMRERVALFGGSLEAGPRPQGGYRVLARFPIEAAGSESQAGPARDGEATR